MLGSFGVGSSHDHDNNNQDHHPEDQDHHHPPLPQPTQPPLPPNVYLHHHQQILPLPAPPIHMRQLLITCAELISRSDLSAAHRLITILSTNSTPYGDATERLIHHFTKGLSLRLNRILTNNPLMTAAVAQNDENALVQSSYLSLNQITPFLRFSHLTANQAILEAVNGHQSIHIIDFDIMHGVQWPPLMQALAERYPPPTLRITGTGHNLDILRKTGDRLAKFAHSLGLRFQFHPLIITTTTPDHEFTSSSLLLLPDETLAVNCVHYLHRLLKDRDRDQVRLFLHQIKSINPRVLTFAEREANHNHPVFIQRFSGALDHYSAIFDSLEATLPPASQERLAVEQVWFGREIADVVAAEGESRKERHEMFRTWEVMLRSCGFGNLPLSPFALSQAKLLLRLHYPSEGYQLHVVNDCCFLGWQNHPLFSVSSWH